jgi:putative ABC transport system substrate-binding protein
MDAAVYGAEVCYPFGGKHGKHQAVKRRQFITLLGGAAAWPLAARAQQGAMPVIGFLNNQSPDTNVDRLRAFRQGLKDTGHVEGENVAIEYRWAENQIDRLPVLATELVRRQVALIATTVGTAPALAAKAATTTIPIVFAVGEDPVRLGLVENLARPGHNLTGINYFNSELVAKRLELLREMVPVATRVAVLVNPTGPTADTTVRDVERAARAMGLQVQIFRAGTSREIDTAFATIARECPDAVYVGNEPFFNSRRVQLVHRATLHKVPATYSQRQYPEIGGLMSYGTNVTDAFRQVGVYAGRILKGAKPADLPVVQATKFELVVNAQTARMLDLTVPPTLLATAEEVIE